MINRRKFLASVPALALAGCTSQQTTTKTSTEPVSRPDFTVPTPYLGLEDRENAIVVMEFGDMQCPHCQTYENTVFPELKSTYIDDEPLIRYEHYDFSIPINEYSSLAPKYARAVQQSEGLDAFWAYKKLVYENQSNIDETMLKDFVTSVGGNLAEVTSLLDSNSTMYEELLESQRQYGIDLGVEGTPQVIVEGELVSRASFEAIANKIDKNL